MPQSMQNKPLIRNIFLRAGHVLEDARKQATLKVRSAKNLEASREIMKKYSLPAFYKRGGGDLRSVSLCANRFVR